MICDIGILHPYCNNLIWLGIGAHTYTLRLQEVQRTMDQHGWIATRIKHIWGKHVLKLRFDAPWPFGCLWAYLTQASIPADLQKSIIARSLSLRKKQCDCLKWQFSCPWGQNLYKHCPLAREQRTVCTQFTHKSTWTLKQARISNLTLDSKRNVCTQVHAYTYRLTA